MQKFGKCECHMTLSRGQKRQRANSPSPLPPLPRPDIFAPPSASSQIWWKRGCLWNVERWEDCENSNLERRFTLGGAKTSNRPFNPKIQRPESGKPRSLNAPEFGTVFKSEFHTISKVVQAPKHTRSPAELEHKSCDNGPYKADCSQIHRRQGPKEAAGYQGSSQVRSSHRRSQEASQVLRWHSTLC